MAPASQPRISETVLTVSMWTGVGVATCFVIFRLFARLRVFKRLYWDDALVVLALLCFAATAASRMMIIQDLYDQYAVAAGSLLPTLDLLNSLLQGVHINLAGTILSATCLWSVKFSFLVLFRRLGAGVRSQRNWWWVVTAFTAASYLSLYGVIPYRCMTGSLQYTLQECFKPRPQKYNLAVFRYQMVIDMATDLLIISIPVHLLWNLQLPLKQKLKLGGLFSLTVVIIAFAIIRLVVWDHENSKITDLPWIFFWSNMEATVALIVASLGSFRQLFLKSSPATMHLAERGHRWPNGTLFVVNKNFSNNNRSHVSNDRGSQTQLCKTIQPEEDLQPLRAIFVSHEVEVKHGEPSLHDESKTSHVTVQSVGCPHPSHPHPFR